MKDIIKKAVIITGYKCNSCCRFCMNIGLRDFYKSTKEIVRDMVFSRERGKTHLSLFGGENSIRPDIIYLIKTAKKLGFKEIVIGTNGRMFSYKDFAKKIIDAGLTDLYFSIHGHNSRIHDYLTQVSGSFNQLIKGIANVKSLGFKRFGSHTTIVKPNYKYLPQIGRLIYSLGIRSAEFLYVNPSLGGAHRHFKKLMPRISEAAPYIKGCLDIGKRNNILDWAVSHVPMCYFAGYEKQINQPDQRRIKNEIQPIESQYIFNQGQSSIDNTPHVSVQKRIKTEKCLDCKYGRVCLGIWKEYIKQFGDAELVPLR